MRISLNWLKKYIDIKISAQELAERLTMAGFEVESIERLGEKYNNFVVGEVLEVQKHPNADRLNVCKVNSGSEVLQIVCGAQNVAQHQKVAVGLIGATIPRNQHDPDGQPFVLLQAKLRGIDSFGMICSPYELELGDDKDGIMILNPQAKPGLNLADYLGLGDTVFEVAITPNRPDAMCHFGLAREVAALLNRKLKLPSLKIKESRLQTKNHVTVKILDKVNCPRYSARLILGVAIASSPQWLKELLSSVSIRPVNNVVDITNYILMEIGHPLHAFDYDKISQCTIVVKKNQQGKPFTTLDHKSRVLRDDTLMICDAQKPIAIAGIMGGEHTEISASTKNILIESAYFKPESIRRSARYFGLSSDASQRFERGADPNITAWAIDRASQLIQEICGGEILKGIVDEYSLKIRPRVVNLRHGKANEILGTTLNESKINQILKKIEIEPIKSRQQTRKQQVTSFQIPTFRPDIDREIDLIEEVARIFGYNNIKTELKSSITFSEVPLDKDHNSIIREWLIGYGYNEIVANSMQMRSIASLASNDIVEIANPISSEMGALRTSLVPGILHIVKNNIFHGISGFRLFELGKVYFRDRIENKGIVPGFIEESRLVLALSGIQQPYTWDSDLKPPDIYDLKGDVQSLFSKIFLDNIKFIPYSTTKALSTLGLSVEIHDEALGTIEAISKNILNKFEIEQDVFIAELKVDVIRRYIRKEVKFKPLPKFPAVTRDVAFVVDKNIEVEKIENKIRVAGGKLLTKVRLFDIYLGDQIPFDKKSVAFALEFMSEDHTLHQEQVDHIMQNIIQNVSVNLHASLRG